MSDPNLTEFYGRIARIETARAKGYGHEAAGTLGRSSFHHPTRKRTTILRSMLFVGLCVFGLKGAIYHSVGDGSYNARVAQLMAGEGFDRLGGWMMQADPVTLWVAEQIEVIKQRIV